MKIYANWLIMMSNRHRTNNREHRKIVFVIVYVSRKTADVGVRFIYFQLQGIRRFTLTQVYLFHLHL